MENTETVNETVNPTVQPVVTPEPAKPERVAKAKTELKGTELTFTFSDAAKSVVTFKLSDYPSVIVERLAMHGLEQKLRDCYAAKDIDAAQAVGAQAKVNDALLAGDWTVKGEAAEPKEDSQELLARGIVRALASLTPPQVKTLDEAKEMVAGMTKGDRAKFRAKPKVALAIAQIRAEEDNSDSL